MNKPSAMKPAADKATCLLLILAGLLVAVAFLEAFAPGSLLLRIVILLLSLVVTGLLLRQRRAFRKRQAEIFASLERVGAGNLNTRLLTDGEHFEDDFIFAVNRLIEQLDDLQIQAVNSEAARKRMLSSFSHDLRTPLTSIIGYVDALQDDLDLGDEEKAAYLEIVRKKAGGLKKMIDEIFLMAKLDADEVPLNPERLDLAELARTALIEYLPVLTREGITLQAEIPEQPCWVTADRLSLNRILANLIANGVQHGGQGRLLGLRLDVELPEKQSGWRLEIWDRGPGIPAEALEEVFERLYRADAARSSLTHGSGLGLAIALRLAQLNDGRLWAESTPGEKTSFFLFLPQAV